MHDFTQYTFFAENIRRRLENSKIICVHKVHEKRVKQNDYCYRQLQCYYKFLLVQYDLNTFFFRSLLVKLTSTVSTTVNSDLYNILVSRVGYGIIVIFYTACDYYCVGKCT